MREDLKKSDKDTNILFMMSPLNLRQWIAQYYDHPLLTKVEDQPSQGTHVSPGQPSYSIYMGQFQTLLMNEYRYLIAIAPRDLNFIGTTQYLEQIPWVSFQTRTLTENHHLPILSYHPKTTGTFHIVIDRITATDSDSTYSAGPFPATITLLVRPDQMYHYPEQGTLSAALETFETILVLLPSTQKER
jgi:hypothetical protein